MSLTTILTIEVFDCWSIDFIRLFLISKGYSYVLVVVDYVSKWMEVGTCRNNDRQTVITFNKENILPRFGVPKTIISNGGSHFCKKALKKLIKKYHITHKISTPYHLQSNGQVELANRQIKQILGKMVNPSHKNWSLRLVL